MGWMGEPSALTFVAAAVGWLVVGVLPGLLLVTALTPSRSLLDRLAVAPAVSIGVAYPAAAWANVVGVDRAVAVAAVSLVLASVGSGVVLLRRSRRHGLALRAGLRELRPLTWPVVLVVLLWVTAVPAASSGWGLVPPNSDGENHGLLVVQILQEGRVVGFGGYPAGMHVVAAMVGGLTSVPSALAVPLTLLGPVWVVLGVGALAARISPRVAVWSGLAACVVPYFPAAQAYWGPVPLVLAVALVPPVALAVVDADRSRARVVAVMAVAGLLAIHVTEALVAGALAVLVLVLRAGPRRRPVLVPLALGAAALALVAPLVAELARGGAERPTDTGLLLGASPSDAAVQATVMGVLQPFVGAVATDPRLWLLSLTAAVVLVVVTVVGMRASWSSAYGRATTLLVLALLVLSVLARAQVAGVLASPWYGNGYRVLAQVAALVPVPLGVGLHRLVASARGRAAFRPAAAVIGVSLVVVGLVNTATARRSLSGYSVVTPGDRAAFAWLGSRAQPGEAVLNDNGDGSVWIVDATRGAARPVFGGNPGGGFQAYPSWSGRLYLQKHVADFETDPEVRALAAEWHVRFVFVGERTFADAPRLLDVGALESAPGIREVFRSGGARVFELPVG